MDLKEKIFNVSAEGFDALALEVFRWQALENSVYSQYLSHLKIKSDEINSIYQIPFMPIEVFKTHAVFSGIPSYQLSFESSGTTGAIPSKHFIKDVSWYHESLERTFKTHFGAPDDFVFMALLPSYLERGKSSLVYMVDRLMELNGQVQKHFYLNNFEELMQQIRHTQATSPKKIFLIGVTYALLDLADIFKENLSDIIVMETGGMKGRKKEMTREEVHAHLKESWQTFPIYSEYGMTELLSQAYTKADGKFYPPPYMKILIRDIYDPFSYMPPTQTGAINVIDLANYHSCAFIATQDAGRLYPNGSFDVLGRMDNSEVRGCNLLYI
ncbi:MAG: acyl transferase [Bacteroidetes bacterium]|nr:acyl transferase [Bacteroidota bacterium]